MEQRSQELQLGVAKRDRPAATPPAFARKTVSLSLECLSERVRRTLQTVTDFG